jgi:hypothetical protein
MSGECAVDIEWSTAAIDAAAQVVCVLSSGIPACRCGGGCRRVAKLALAAGLTAEWEARRGGGTALAEMLVFEDRP